MDTLGNENQNGELNGKKVS